MSFPDQDDLITAKLETLCRQMADDHSDHSEGCSRYRPTGNQIFFFALVRLQKKKKKDEKSNFQHSKGRKKEVTAHELLEWIQLVASHLKGESGSIVANLQIGTGQKWDEEWELVRLQIVRLLEKKTGRDNSVDIDIATSSALVKLLILVQKMAKCCNPSELDAKEDLVAYVSDSWSMLTNIYDFRSHFYTYAKQIGYNELRNVGERDGEILVLLTTFGLS